MAKATFLLIIVVALLLIGSCVYLAYSDLPVTRSPVQKVLPDARFPK